MSSRTDRYMRCLSAYSPLVLMLCGYVLHLTGLAIIALADRKALLPFCVLAAALLALILTLRDKWIPIRELEQQSGMLICGQCIASLIIMTLAATKFVEYGVPLFATDPDLARMDFTVNGGIVLKSFSAIGFFLIILHFINAKTCTGALRWANVVVLACVCIEFILLGSKSQMALFLLMLLWAEYATGVAGAFGRLLKCSFFIVAAVVLNFLLVVGGDLQSTLLLILARVSYLQAQGIYISFSDPDLGLSDFVASATNIFDRLSGNVPYSISLSNIISSKFYGRDPYDSPFAMTITAYSDFYLVAGLLGCVIAICLVPYLSHKILHAAFTAVSPMKRAFCIALFMPFINIVFKGGVVGTVWGELIPYIFFAVLYMSFAQAIKHVSLRAPENH